MPENVHVTVWNEFRHEKEKEPIGKIYPEGMHGAIAGHLNTLDNIQAGTATLDEPDHGLSEEVLAKTDVMIWWGHAAHHEVKDEIAAKVQKRVLEGMGLVVLHSGHLSKPFKLLMGTGCTLKWREQGEREVLWVTRPGHPILDGIEDFFTLEHTEMYGEFFDVPEPDETILISSFEGGEVFRSGMTFNRGAGKVFYFRPGHETYPIFHNPTVLKIIGNAVGWAAPTASREVRCDHKKQLGWWKEA
jgi:trehalose utilization protein